MRQYQKPVVHTALSLVAKSLFIPTVVTFEIIANSKLVDPYNTFHNFFIVQYRIFFYISNLRQPFSCPTC